ncbi:MAG: Fic family protein [Candidatus Marinimicrobia bacterium]|nr:Fic family protein [Candidatus Neomarinimicrobiota bacterium]
MTLVILTQTEQKHLFEMFKHLTRLGEQYPLAREEAMTALRCLKAIHSNAIEDKRVDRIFLQVLLHGAGIAEKSHISIEYQKASVELKGQDYMLKWLESEALQNTELSISMLLEMHRMMFEDSWAEGAGQFRQSDVKINLMSHKPPHFSQIAQLLHQQFTAINESLFSPRPDSEHNFSETLNLSARAHYLVANVHPFDDGNGRIARALGDYIMLVRGFYYDVIMTEYKDHYLDSLEECSLLDATPLSNFLKYSYLETLQRILGFFELVSKGNNREVGV